MHEIQCEALKTSVVFYPIIHCRNHVTQIIMSSSQEQNRNSGRNGNRNNNNRNRSNNNNRNSHRNDSGARNYKSQKPDKLTFWQKLLKLIGLYKEPVKSSGSKQTATSTAVKNNTRSARAPKETRSSGETRPPRERREQVKAEIESTRLYIGNLSYDAAESDIEDLFKGVGPVRSVEIVYNKHTHKSKGYGFVEMLHIDEAKRSVEVLHDQHFMGRKLIVSGAKAKNEFNDQDEHSAKEEFIANEKIVEEVHSLEMPVNR
jgi:RNA recognition motif. (a.k.a. RRM, RBD, or RNP domain)